MTRHIGRNNSTNEQAVVMWMLIPGQTTHALVSYPDRLREPLRSELMSAVGSVEGQRAETLADVLGRRQYADTQKPILQVLHEMNALQREALDDIVMTPDGNHRIPLREVLEAIGQLDKGVQKPEERFNPHVHNTVAEGQNEQVGVARNLFIEAEMLEADARNKRAQAYNIAPSLNPANAAPVATVTAEAEAAPDTNVE